MRPRLPTLVFGVVNLGGRCPHCRSRFVRVSSETYEGGPARLLRLAAYRCRDCKRHFAVPPYAWLGPATALASPACPSCGSQKTVDSAAEPGGFLARFASRKPLRCLTCRLRFVATDRRQFLANLVLLGAALAGLAFAASLLGDKQPWLRPPPKPRPKTPRR